MNENDLPKVCPVDGCDWDNHTTKDNPLPSLRSHITARPTNTGHDWEAVRERLESTDSEGDESTDGTTDADPDDTGPKGGGDGGDTPEDTPESGGSDGSDEDDDQMPTDDEYQQQHSGSNDGGDSNGGTDTGDDGGAGLPSMPVDPRTLMLLVAVAAVGYVAYRAMSGDDTPTDPSPDAGGSDRAADTGGQTPSDGGEPGGLMG